MGITEHLTHGHGPPAIPTGLKFTDLVPTPTQLQAVLAPPFRAPKATLLERKNEASLTAAEQAKFKAAVQQLIDRGTYDKFVQLHALNYSQHTVMVHPPPRTPYSGAVRFLPWHRVFLMKFEAELQRIDPTVAVPYWEWTRRRDIPPWLKDFKPNGITREPGTPEQLPTREDIWTRLQTHPYATLTLLLEGWTPALSKDPRGVNLGGAAHNLVHGWVGGDMGVVSTAVKDPLFWLHHAEVDRLWHVWQRARPGDHPVFVPLTDAVMDPWAETYADVHDIRAVGYRYEDETFDPRVMALKAPLPSKARGNR